MYDSSSIDSNLFLVKHTILQVCQKYLDNAQKAEAMLQLPIQERIRRSVVQYHSPELHPIFVNQINLPKPVVSESKQPNVAWQPDDPSEILQADIEEHNSSALLVAQKSEVKFQFDDFVFPVLNIKNEKYQISLTTA